MPIFMQITGKVQGRIQGGVTQHGHEGSIQVNSLDYSVTEPLDAASGLPNGKRQHQPLQVTVPTGHQTPLLFQAATSNETLSSVVLQYYLADKAGKETLAFVVTLTDAHLAELDLNAETDSNDYLDSYSFSFRKIELNWTIPNEQAEDDWSSPSA